MTDTHKLIDELFEVMDKAQGIIARINEETELGIYACDVERMSIQLDSFKGLVSDTSELTIETYDTSIHTHYRYGRLKMTSVHKLC